MPIDEEPNKSSEPTGPEESMPATPLAVEEQGGLVTLGTSSSRWLDYDTHELLSMISDLEDERRWARLREGVWIAILLHLVIISAATWIPRYVFKVPVVVDQNDKLNKHKDFTYLDTPYQLPPKAVVKPLQQQPVIDKKTLEAIKRETPPSVEPPATAPTPAPSPTQPQPIPPSQQSQSQVEAPRPAAVPARPNFAMGSQNPGDQLRDAMKGAARNPGMGGGTARLGGGGLARHPGAGTGGVQVLSDTQGVDFSNWLQRWHWETQRTWDPLIPDEVNAPINKSGVVAIRFKVLPNGRLMEGGMVLEGRSGDVALDRAAWGALTGSNYPPLPRDFHGPYLELRAYFLYNTELH
jgi:outer membrane biosynthesis protein TonB